MKPGCTKQNCPAVCKKILGMDIWACDPCSAESQTEEEAKAKRIADAAKLVQWNEICPPLYQDTDTSRLNQAQRQEIIRWKLEIRRGALHLGSTGIGKSRTAYESLRIAFIERNCRVKAVRSSVFGTELAALFSRSAGQAKDLVHDCINADVFLWDDLGKGKMTERVESELFSILDERMIYMRPTIITSNLDLPGIAGLWSVDKKEPVLRRIIETMEIIG